MMELTTHSSNLVARSSTFPMDPKAWVGPAVFLRALRGVWIIDWATAQSVDAKLDQLAGLLRTKIVPGAAEFETDVYISHAWGTGTDGVADNHDKASRINAALQARGYRTRFDAGRAESVLSGSALDLSITHGIERTQLTILCLSKRYLDKLASPSIVDPCKKEFTCALAHKGRSGMLLPIAIESFVVTPSGSSGWAGKVTPRGHRIGVALPGAAAVVQRDQDAQLEASLKALDLGLTRRERYKTGEECVFNFVRASKLRAATEPPPRMQELQKQHPGWLVRVTISISNVLDGSLREKYLVVSHRSDLTAASLSAPLLPHATHTLHCGMHALHSHCAFRTTLCCRWELPGLPDEHGVQFAALQAYLMEHLEIEFVWVECVCRASRIVLLCFRRSHPLTHERMCVCVCHMTAVGSACRRTR